MQRQDIINAVVPVLQAARLYHRHEIVGLEHVPKSGKALVVVNHSLATYDITLLITGLYTDLGRLPRPLVDRLFFRVPYLGELCEFLGAVQGSQKSAMQLLEAGELITVAPGGMREALRPSSERYQIRWDKRLGFARLAIQTQAPVILAACPKADDMYDVYPSRITSWFYRHFKVPVFFARGIGVTPLPRPVKLTHFLSEPIVPPKLLRAPTKASDAEMQAYEEAFKEQVQAFHEQLVSRMHELIGTAIQHR